ncbi:MAG TPA: HlyD family efflux transporter periplasmic adaptor subunit [Candidatus Eisenbacteria bacterium]|jgi:multidrug efflux pump subunit AcrA (membrane-fusion protein)|nr:HlyD family efflux transporter periplasmic adaptor subunit [Candidatus Eisenbacteria bacterium]
MKTWIVLLGVLVAGCSRGGGQEADSEGAGAPVPVRTMALESRSFHDVLSAPGQWQSGSELVINAATAGQLEDLRVAVGDRVSAGQRVGTLIPRDSWAGLQGARILVGEARTAAERADGQRALHLAQRDLVRVPLVAQEAGVVIRRSAEPGSSLAEAAEILAIAPWSTVVFEAHVPAAKASIVRPGQAALVEVPDGATRVAKVERVLPMASEADQTILIWLKPGVLTPSPALGRFGTAQITLGPPRTALAAPDSAVIEDDLTGEHRVAVVDAQGVLNWRQVAIGIAENGWREVSAPGLAPGTRIVAEGQRGLADGTKVAEAK